MTLDNIDWEIGYKSNQDPKFIVENFLKPAYENSGFYFRTSAFFSSSVFDSIGDGIVDFVQNGGEMMLVTNVRFSEQDQDAINKGNKKYEELIEEKVQQIIEEEFKSPMGEGTMTLMNMLAIGRLKIKVGYKVKGELHEKSGVFFDSNSIITDLQLDNSDLLDENLETLSRINHLAYGGSMNDSVTALENNHEKINVYWSWSYMHEYAKKEIKDFLLHWSNSTPGLKVIDFSEAAKDNMIRSMNQTKKFYPDEEEDEYEEDEYEEDEYEEDLVSEEENDIWVHQKKAVDLFLADKNRDIRTAPKPAGGQGILCMATGTGKTRTALKIVKKMLDIGKIKNIIITTLRTDILDQWEKEMRDPKRGLNNLIKAKYKHYDGKKDMYKYLDSGSETKSILIGRDNFVKLMKDATREELEDTLLIVDECHNFRGEGHIDNMSGLYRKIPYRLGLSATPNSEYDEKATQFMFDEIGDIYFEFGLKEAIEKGILCSFEYHSFQYTPSDKDRAKAKSIRGRYAKKIEQSPHQRFKLERDMYRELSDVYKQSKEKIPLIKEVLSNQKNILKRTIIFGPNKKWNKEVEVILSEENARFIKYYGETDKTNLKVYEAGDIEVLLTCDAIKEGVDLDVNDIVLICSNRAKLENIQRIGRALRTHGDPDKVARVYDFIGHGVAADQERQAWLEELSKIKNIMS